MILQMIARSVGRASGVLFCAQLWAAWVPLGPFGGSASVVVADPNSPKTFLAGTRSALLFRSSDAGESWSPIPFPAQFHATLNVLAVNPETPGVYLAGMSSELPQYSGLLRSIDSGATWQQVPDLRNQSVRAIALKRAAPEILAVGTDSGAFASRDGGTTWGRISPIDNSQLRPVVALAFDPKDSATLYAGTPHLPWKTSDWGASWHSIHSGMLDDSDVFSIQVDRNRPQRVFASACSGIYRTVNGAATWTRLNEAKNASDRTYVIVQDPQRENVWFAGTTHSIVRSSDGGTTWRKLAPYTTRSISFDPGRLGRLFIATDDKGILRSDDNGDTWQSVNNGFSNRRLSPLWTVGRSLYTTLLDGPQAGSVMLLSPDFDKWFTATKASLRSIPSVLFSPPWARDLFLAKFESGLFVSEDTGRTWNGLDWPIPTDEVSGFFALDRPWIAAVGASGIYLSKDGKSWRPCPGALSEVYAVSSTRRGLLAATVSGLKASADMGASWRAVPGELETDTVQAICRHPLGKVLFAAKYGTIYTSIDEGHSWRRISPEKWPVSSVRQLIVLSGEPDHLLVLTHQQGVWAFPLDGPPVSYANR